MSGSELLQYIFSGLTNGSIYALTATGFSLIFSATKVINFAQGQFVMLGGLVASGLYQVGLPLWGSFLAAVAVVAAVALIFEQLAIRPLLDYGVLAQIIATVGASFVFETGAMLIWGRDAQQLPAFPGDTPLYVGGAALLPQTLWVIGLTVAIVGGLEVFYRLTFSGKAVRACASNPVAARLYGIPYKRTVMLIFALTGAISAAAGAMITPISFMAYSSGALLGLKGFVAATLGGLGSAVGAVAGGYLLGLLEALGVAVVSAGYKDAIAFIVLLLVLFLRPAGLLGKREIGKV